MADTVSEREAALARREEALARKEAELAAREAHLTKALVRSTQLPAAHRAIGGSREHGIAVCEQ